MSTATPPPRIRTSRTAAYVHLAGLSLAPAGCGVILAQLVNGGASLLLVLLLLLGVIFGAACTLSYLGVNR